MARKDRPKREAPISYRPPERLREEFYTRVLNSGLPVSAFITAAVFGREAPRARRLPPLEQQMLTQLLSQSARISDGLRAAPQRPPPTAEAAAQAALLKECRDELAEIRTCLMNILGRDP